MELKAKKNQLTLSGSLGRTKGEGEGGIAPEVNGRTKFSVLGLAI
jgi:hypothetical protein